MKNKPEASVAPLNFESAMERLEEIVEQMESGKMPLDDLIVRYEEGMKLVKICQERLASAEQRIEIITSFYKHPLEILLDSFISSLILYPVVGVEPAAAAAAVMLSGLAELVYHWNVTTPHWLGYVFQRPESHCIHHQEGVHAFNYSDLPLWDMMFGTFRNPEQWDARCGFGPRGEFRLGEMLRGVDIHRADAEKNRGSA